MQTVMYRSGSEPHSLLPTRALLCALCGTSSQNVSCPPSMTNWAPVMKPESSEAK
jgi:hypothetical protein